MTAEVSEELSGRIIRVFIQIKIFLAQKN